MNKIKSLCITFSSLVIFPTLSMDNRKQSFIYSHGFGSTSEKATSYVKKNLIPQDVIRFNYQDADLRLEPIKGIGLGFKLWKSAFGQKNDIKRLAEQVNKITHKNLVLFGESRGASTIINYLGSDHCQNNIKAVVVDSPFDTMYNALSHRMNRFYLDKIVSIQKAEKILSYLTQYTLDGPKPLISIKQIPKKYTYFIYLF